MTEIILRDYQRDVIRRIREALREGYKAPLVVSPTGSGKTIMFATIARGAKAKGNRILILVHRKEILRQTLKSLYNLGVRSGQIASGKPMTSEAIQVAMVSTVVRRLDKIHQPDMIIVDECHHSQGDTYKKILSYWEDTPILGFTATPQRLDGKGLDDIYDCMIKGPSTAWLVANGFLSPPILFTPSREVTEKYHMKRGDYDTSEQEEVMTDKVIVGDVVENYRRRLGGLPAVCFCVSVKHSKMMAQAFRDAGYSAVAVYGDMSAKERDRAISGLADGSVNVVTSCDVISEGVDVPVLAGAILLRRTASLALYLQWVGRALRIYPDKTHALILDHAGNYYLHGHPIAERKWTLEGRRKGERRNETPPEITRCPECLTVWPGKIRVCPECGYIFKTAEEVEAETRKTPTEIAGELTEVLGGTPEESMQLAGFLARIQGYSKEKRKRAVMAKCYELKDKDAIEAMRRVLGYKKGWAYWAWNTVRKKTG